MDTRFFSVSFYSTLSQPASSLHLQPQLPCADDEDRLYLKPVPDTEADDAGIQYSSDLICATRVHNIVPTKGMVEIEHVESIHLERQPPVPLKIEILGQAQVHVVEIGQTGRSHPFEIDVHPRP
jgi:hypothetical protein